MYRVGPSGTDITVSFSHTSQPDVVTLGRNQDDVCVDKMLEHREGTALWIQSGPKVMNHGMHTAGHTQTRVIRDILTLSAPRKVWITTKTSSVVSRR